MVTLSVLGFHELSEIFRQKHVLYSTYECGVMLLTHWVIKGIFILIAFNCNQGKKTYWCVISFLWTRQEACNMANRHKRLCPSLGLSFFSVGTEHFQTCQDKRRGWHTVLTAWDVPNHEPFYSACLWKWWLQSSGYHRLGVIQRTVQPTCSQVCLSLLQHIRAMDVRFKACHSFRMNKHFNQARTKISFCERCYGDTLSHVQAVRS